MGSRTDFFIVPWDAFGSFSDNVTVVRNQITKDVKKHEDYVQMIKGLLGSSFPNSEILSEETYELNGVKRTDVTMQVKVQNFDLIMKVNAFISRNYGYQITLVCETSQFERRNVDFEVMIKALELK